VRALAIGWSKGKIGPHRPQQHHLQLRADRDLREPGAVFSQIYGITFTTSGRSGSSRGRDGRIKLHAAIDVLIKGNRIHNAGRGLWMDWMAQGTRISGNLLYDNTTDDLFVEVNHGPFLVDNNFFLSSLSLHDWSQGGAYAHNLMTGRSSAAPSRDVPLPTTRRTRRRSPASAASKAGTNRFYNNILAGNGRPPRRSPRTTSTRSGSPASDCGCTTRGNPRRRGATCT